MGFGNFSLAPHAVKLPSSLQKAELNTRLRARTLAQQGDSGLPAGSAEKCGTSGPVSPVGWGCGIVGSGQGMDTNRGTRGHMDNRDSWKREPALTTPQSRHPLHMPGRNKEPQPAVSRRTDRHQEGQVWTCVKEPQGHSRESTASLLVSLPEKGTSVHWGGGHEARQAWGLCADRLTGHHILETRCFCESVSGRCRGWVLHFRGFFLSGESQQHRTPHAVEIKGGGYSPASVLEGGGG